MCGIAGIIKHNQNFQVFDRNEMLFQVRTMADAVKHRGPDGEGYWASQDASVGFGHRRLSVIDLTEGAAQPMHYLERYTIVYNGEIYNYIELKDHLQKKGYDFKTRSDIEVILAAYDYWKENCLEHFDGMFSFAIWDEKEQTLFAARDRFGEKPFYYYKDDGYFIFASEMKALWSVGVPKLADDKMLLNYVTIGHLQNPVDKAQTFFEDIRSLPAAHYLQLSKSTGKIVIKRYWDIDKKAKIAITEADAIEKLTSLLTTSVKRRLRSDVDFGTSLSGGLDSSSILSLINYLKGDSKKVKTFSAVFPGFEKDESPFIQSVVDKFKTDNFKIEPTIDDLINDFEKVCYHQEEPFSSSSIYIQYKVFELAKQNNIKVLLDGQGADEILAGYHKYYHWYLQQLASKAKFGQLRQERRALKEKNIKIEWGVQNYFATYFPPHTAVHLERKEYNKIIKSNDINPDFIAALHGREWEGIRKSSINKLNDILYFNTMELGLEELLRFADRNSMAHGTEVRLPFLNHRLVEFIFSLPPGFKIHEGWTKWILRKAMNNKLPDNIVWRKDKVGYEPPQQKWMTDPRLQEYIHEAKRKLVNKGVLQQHLLNKKICPLPAHDADNFDWRYLIAAQLL
ncbi:MAG TPA: asparagine synthase (glutamine-hydrolyzing) [Ferruginibacter sp.]|jgi:asparagine synthase (glutamine-hydrolysing)|nr:asparagine synthase (glutamine-hydrolyzing) [Ferruginibacter sp.]